MSERKPTEMPLVVVDMVETVKEFDIHYQRDSFGSNTEFSKD